MNVHVVPMPSDAPASGSGGGGSGGSGGGGRSRRLPDSGLLCGFVFSGKTPEAPDLAGMARGDRQLASNIRQSAADIAGKTGHLATIPVSTKQGVRRVLLAGLGKKGGVTADDIRHVSGRVAKRAKDLKLGAFTIVAPAMGSAELPPDKVASAIAEGSVMSMYKFDAFKSDNGGNDYVDDDDDDDNNNNVADGGGSDSSRRGDGRTRSSRGGSRPASGAPPKKGVTTRTSPAPAATIGPDVISDIISAASGQADNLDLYIAVPGSTTPESLELISESVKKSVSIAMGNLFVRSVANLPPNVCTPQALADIARGVAKSGKGRGIKCTITTKKDLQRRGFGGITAVGQGSKNEPRLIILEYRGRGPAGGDGSGGGTRARKATSRGHAPGADSDYDARPVVLVGKAVTFDTGGISLKPGASMDEMKFDKCGGCTVLGIVKTAAELGLRTRIIGIIPAVENMPGGESYRPGDIIRLYSGKTAEILNTDAEGRLILADALAYGEQHYNPREIIDLATLTGACIVALGTNVAGMISNDEGLAGSIRASSERTAEPVWQLPLDDIYMELIKSSVADMRNMGVGRAAGTIAAAAFLKNAITDTPWAHLDIAGVAWTQTATRARSYKSKGATGFGLRLLMDHLMRLEKE